MYWIAKVRRKRKQRWDIFITFERVENPPCEPMMICGDTYMCRTMHSVGIQLDNLNLGAVLAFRLEFSCYKVTCYAYTCISTCKMGWIPVNSSYLYVRAPSYSLNWVIEIRVDGTRTHGKGPGPRKEASSRESKYRSKQKVDIAIRLTTVSLELLLVNLFYVWVCSQNCRN